MSAYENFENESQTATQGYSPAEGDTPEAPGEGGIKYGIPDFDQYPAESRERAIKAWLSAPEHLRVDRAREAVGLPPLSIAPDTFEDSKPRPNVKTSTIAAIILALAILAGFLLTRGDDALGRAMEARQEAARELSRASVAYDLAKTRHGAAKARYEAAYKLEACLATHTGAIGTGTCR